MFLLFVFTLGFLMARARVDSPAAAKLLWAATAAQMAFIGLCTAVLVGHVTRMTKAVLRAVELARKKE